MAEFLNPIAEVGGVDSGDITTPFEASQMGKEHSFFCPDFDCSDPERRLILKVSKNKNPFFSHHSGYGHDIRPETLLHKLAIKWFKDRTDFEVPEGISGNRRIKKQTLNLDVNKTQLEYSLKEIRPDVKLNTIGGFEFAIEIFVTNDISDLKKELLYQSGIPTLRIDLSDFYKLNKDKCREDKVFVEQHLDSLLNNINLKKWLVCPKEDYPIGDLLMEAVPQNTGCMVILPFIGVIWLLIEWWTKSS